MFLVCGEALYDLFVEGETAAGFRIDARIGGSPFNVAVGLARLGRPAALFAGVSTDPFGDRLAAELAAEGVEARFLVRLPNPTTLAVVALAGNGEPRYAFHGHRAADRSLTRAHLPNLPDAVSCLHFGSFSLVVEPTADALLTLAKRERGRRFISLDPNVRTNVEPDPARWRREVERFARTADLVKLSEEDLGHLDPEADPDTLARAWLDGGARLVVLTKGARGAALWTGARRIDHPGFGVEVVDTVGAGDAFQAALLTALDEGGALTGPSERARPEMSERDARRLLEFACGAAARSCTRRGADFPRRAELPDRPVEGYSG